MQTLQDCFQQAATITTTSQGSWGSWSRPTTRSSWSSAVRTWLQKKIGPALRMGAIARPAIVARLPDHPRSNRIELDVAAAGKEVGLAVDRRRAIASLPQGAGSPIGRVDVAHVAAAKRLHGARQTVGGLWRNQQMHV